MHIYNIDHMSCSGSPGTQMRLMEIRLICHVSHTESRQSCSPVICADAKTVTIKMNWWIWTFSGGWVEISSTDTRVHGQLQLQLQPALCMFLCTASLGLFAMAMLLFTAGWRAHAGASGAGVKVVLPQTNSVTLGALASIICNQSSSPSSIKPVNSYFLCLLRHNLPFSITWPPREVAVVTPPTRASLPTLLP